MIKDEVLQEKIGWSPHETQKEVLKSTSREIVICAGRRWGKSAICGYVVVRTFLQGLLDIKKGKRTSVKIWIVGPSYDLARKVFEYVIRFLRIYDKRFDSYVGDRPFPQLKINESVWIQCRSADEPKSLLGEELDLLVIDEAAQISKTIWFDKLMPTTASKTRQGRTMFISTPVGKNWFYDLFIENKEKGGSFHFTSLDGVEIDKTEWERLKRISPPDWFQQNYEATFLEKASAVFRNVREANFPADMGLEPPYEIELPRRGARYVGGLDLAQIKDYTVLTILDCSSHKQVFFDRFHKISYPLQINRIEAAAKKYGATLLVEINNIGLAVADELKARGVSVDDFRTTGSVSKNMEKAGTKERMINKLAVDIENKNVHLAPIEVQNDELEAYTNILSPSGNITYGAPEGGHDDTVIALGLANWALMGKQRQVLADVARAIPIRRKTFQYN